VGWASWLLLLCLRVLAHSPTLALAVTPPAAPHATILAAGDDDFGADPFAGDDRDDGDDDGSDDDLALPPRAVSLAPPVVAASPIARVVPLRGRAPSGRLFRPPRCA
jgi:hypothetical protein